jgi:hypothetical protein
VESRMRETSFRVRRKLVLELRIERVGKINLPVVYRHSESLIKFTVYLVVFIPIGRSWVPVSHLDVLLPDHPERVHPKEGTGVYQGFASMEVRV